MTKIECPDARTDVDAYFEKSGVLKWKRLNHTPFLAFVQEGDSIVVSIRDSIAKLLLLPDDTQVLGQWTGEWSSDFFAFTVGEARAAHAKAAAL